MYIVSCLAPCGDFGLRIRFSCALNFVSLVLVSGLQNCLSALSALSLPLCLPCLPSLSALSALSALPFVLSVMAFVVMSLFHFHTQQLPATA